jgi:hypothetical protein
MKHAWLALTLVLLVSLLSAANAASPMPTPNPIPRPSSTTGHTDNDQQETERAASAFKNLNQSDRSQTPTATNSPPDGAEHFEGEIATSAIVQSVFAVLLFAATAAVAVFTCQLVSATRALEVATNKMTEAAKAQADAAEVSANVARAALVASARPRMIVRRVSVSRFEGGEPILLQFIVANVGGSPAHILESNFTIMAGTITDLPAIPPYTDFGNEFLGTPTFESGTSKPFTATDPGAIVPSDKTRIYDGGLRYRLLGYIQYRDDSGNIRRTAFCREKKPTQHRFLTVNDPDYEYED